MLNYSDVIILIMELVGTVAFAASGAMTAIQKKMDIFGVNVLGVTTAVGGGMIRDLLLGLNPPNMFRNSIYAMTAIATSTLLFIILYISKRAGQQQHHALYDQLLLVGDTIGLGIFTVVGCHTAISAGFSTNRFLVLFVGVLTGVGGGMLRDIMAQNMPYILVKHVYAVASLAGASVYLFLFPFFPDLTGMLMGAVTVMVVRILAIRYKWNLPHV